MLLKNRLVIVWASFYVVWLLSAVASADVSDLYVTAEVLNVRDEPFPDSEVVYQLRLNERIQIIDELNGWGAIQNADRPGETFWVSLEFLSDQPVAPKQSVNSGSESEYNFVDYVKVGFVGTGFVVLWASKGGKRDRRRKSGFKDDHVRSWKGMLIGILMMAVGWLI